MNWTKQQRIYERKAYRITQDHIKKILSDIPINNASINTYEYLFQANITHENIYAMFKDIYSTIGIEYGNKVKKTLESTKKANILFNDVLLKEILLFLSNEGGIKITSVRTTLIEDLLNAVKLQLELQGTVINIRDAIYAVISRSQQFYKWQALRIARTETTSASNLAAIKTAEQSDLALTKTWISVQDDRTRIKPFDHLDMNRQVQDLEKPFFVGGEEIQYPGSVNASPGNVINCRCSVAFTAKRDKDGNLIFK